MKKIIIPLLLVLLVALAACGSSSTADDQSATTTTDAATTDAVTVTTEMELVIGTFKLDGTENEVTSGEAADLVPLWQAYLALSQSDTTAQAELDALIEQIKEVMGSEKMDAIAAMKLTQDDMFAFMQDNGITMGGRNATDASGTPVAGPDAGGFTSGTRPDAGSAPSGTMPQGGGADMGQGDTTMDPAAIATMQASGVQAPARAMRVPVALVEALIEFLQAK